jgi:hypothetical protein
MTESNKITIKMLNDYVIRRQSEELVQCFHLYVLMKTDDSFEKWYKNLFDRTWELWFEGKTS